MWKRPEWSYDVKSYENFNSWTTWWEWTSICKLCWCSPITSYRRVLIHSHCLVAVAGIMYGLLCMPCMAWKCTLEVTKPGNSQSFKKNVGEIASQTYPTKIWPFIWYSTSILGSWNSHWHIQTCVFFFQFRCVNDHDPPDRWRLPTWPRPPGKPAARNPLHWRQGTGPCRADVGCLARQLDQDTDDIHMIQYAASMSSYKGTRDKLCPPESGL